MGWERVWDKTEPISLLDISEDLYLGRIHASASMILLYYDYLLTLHREIKLLWHKPTVTTVTLLFIRYFTLLSYIPMSVALYDLRWSDEKCDRYLYFPMVFQIMSNFCCTLLLTLRIHALYNKNRWISGLMIVGFITVNTLSVMAWTSGHRHDAITPAPIKVGCVLRVQGYFTENLLFRLWLGRALFDTMVVSLTIGRTWYMQGFLLNLKVPIARLLTRDGALYFVVVFAAEMGNLIFHSWAVTINQLISRTLIVSALSRLVFNLREEVLLKEMTMTEMETHMDIVGPKVTDFVANSTFRAATTTDATTFTMEGDDVGGGGGDDVQLREIGNPAEYGSAVGDTRNRMSMQVHPDMIPALDYMTRRDEVVLGRKLSLYDTYV